MLPTKELQVESAVEPGLRSPAGPQDRATAARALSPKAGLACHPGARPPSTHTPAHPATAVARREGRAHIGQLCHALYERQGELAICRILGVRSLAKKHGLSAVEEACATALEMGVPDYRFVRRYLERNPQLPLTLRQIDPLIRELVQYRELIEQRTKEMEP